MMIAGTFKLANSTKAIAESNRETVLIPANVELTILNGDVEWDGIVKIRSQNNVLLVRVQDLHHGIGLLPEPVRQLRFFSR
jgi:hypothetical protein